MTNAFLAARASLSFGETWPAFSPTLMTGATRSKTSKNHKLFDASATWGIQGVALEFSVLITLRLSTSPARIDEDGLGDVKSTESTKVGATEKEQGPWTCKKIVFEGHVPYATFRVVLFLLLVSNGEKAPFSESISRNLALYFRNLSVTSSSFPILIWDNVL